MRASRRRGGEGRAALVNFVAFIALATLATTAISACNAPEETIVLKNVPVDSVVFWPPSVRYAHNGELLFLHMRGVKRQRRCAKADTLSWSFRRDSLGAEYFTPKSSFQANASCASDPKGLDSLYKVRVYTLVGRYFYLETPDGRLTDSVLFISGDSTLPSRTDTILHVAASGNISVKDRITFRDSTAAHPRRTVEAYSLATCEVLQAAVFDKRGDTLAVRVRSIQGLALPVGLLPACAGVHADTIEVVPNLHRFP